MSEDVRRRDLQQLMVALAASADDGQPAPCTDPKTGHRWLSESRSDQAWAVGHCGRCPALEACERYVETHREAAGVWAGRSPGGKRRSAQGEL